MKNIFFTDGDAALSFISADAGRTTKIDQVKNAIRSLLGLGLLEDVEGALRNARGKLLKKQRDEAPSDELAIVTQQLQDKEAERDTVVQDLATARTRAQELEHRLAEAEKEYERVLALGNYEELAAQRERIRHSLERCRRQEEALVDEHTSLLKSRQLSWGVLGERLVAGLSVLRGLYDQGLIPKTSIPVLRDRLERRRCICGASLSPGSDARRQVEQLIEYEKGADDHSKLLTLLHNLGDADYEDCRTAPQFLTMLQDLRLRRGEALKAVESANREYKELDDKLADIDQADIEAKRMKRNSAKDALEQARRRVTELEMRLKTLEPEISALDAKQTELRRHNARLSTLNAQIDAIADLTAIVSASLMDMQNVYLGKVSARMNTLFLDMIGADPAAGSVYQSAEITPEYEIVVNSLDGRRLNPDHEVNGASQRALTFSFIWALTEVSGVAAPRVIDTPLGMMAGAVKRRVLELIAEPPAESTLSQRADHQVVLLLTQSEIADTEDILDRRVGSAVTFSNSEDHPRDLTNRPAVDRPTIFTCRCTHRECCSLCERKSRANYHLTHVGT
jgi:DNA sulfur modification protein DndD